MDTTRVSWSDSTTELSEWQILPDNILLHIFSYLPASSVLQAAITCSCWCRVSRDEFLWRLLFYGHWRIDRCIAMAPGRSSWLEEYQRLYYHTPVIESEVIREHSDQVLHVSFSHCGNMFATCSKDGYVRVWNALYPVTLKYKEDMAMLTWKYTQFSQFNESDTLLLVSGVHFGANSTSGEIAVFSLKGEFELQARVINKPYDMFGTWYNDRYLLSGTLTWTGHLESCSTLWINNASQETESEHESVVKKMYRFCNNNASTIRNLMVATYTEKSSDDGIENMLHKTMSKMNVDSDSRNEDGGDVTDSRDLIQLDENNDRRTGTTEYGRDYCQALDQIQMVLQRDLAELNSEQDTVLCNTMATSQYSGSEDHGLSKLVVSCQSTDSLVDVMSPGQVLDSHTLSGAQVRNEGDGVTDDEDLLCSTRNGVVSCAPGGGRLCRRPCQTECHTNSSKCTCDGSMFLLKDDYRRDSCRSGMYTDGSVYGSPLNTNYVATCDNSSDKHSGKYCAVGKDMRLSDSGDSANMTSEKEMSSVGDKYLVFTMGSETYTPHQIGIKRMKSLEKVQGSDSTLRLLPTVEDQALDFDDLPYDYVDKVIDMHGHIIGMCFSPDQRYLYVNNRPWPKNYHIENALYPPPIAQEIDIHVIDLLSMEEVGTIHSSHKAYTPNDECFFIFLDVCKDYVASGAEDRHGYLWDRHYGVCLTRFPHTDVVNSVAFNPRDTETLVTVSDDFSIKVWRSRSREHQVKVDNLPCLCTQS